MWKFFLNSITAVGAFLGIIVVGVLMVPWVFQGRVLPFVVLGDWDVSGISLQQLPGVVSMYERALLEKRVSVAVRDIQHAYTLGDLSIHVDNQATRTALSTYPWHAIVRGKRSVKPALTVQTLATQQRLYTDFESLLVIPQNATLTLLPSGVLQTVPSVPGETIDVTTLLYDLEDRIAQESLSTPIHGVVIPTPAQIQNHEVEAAKAMAQTMLTNGFTVTHADQQWVMQPFTIKRLLTFIPVPDPQQPTNYILGVAFQKDALADYVTKTLVPEINVDAQNARFEVVDGQVQQFAMPQAGYQVAIDESIEHINQALAAGQDRAVLSVVEQEPNVADLADIQSFGVTNLLARGETDFAGSPKNRIHNITVGASRYHGLLIPPGTEFSFNKYLGPVTAEAGFKPELVIKHNVTTPEFGGGLCQVSTTLFRASMYAGMPITARRNHAYVVRYYGKPGFDATIYPTSTDFRFMNNTPSYILIQTKFEGTKLIIELWGTSDGRQVAVEGPSTYDARPDGSVKAVLSRTITHSDGTVEEKESFYSRYRSPSLFPKTATQ